MRKALLAFVLAACSNDIHGHTMVIVDGPGSGSASPDAPIQSGPNSVKLDFFGTPDLIVYRDGTGPWVVPAMASGAYQLHVTDDYQVVAACSFAAVAGNEDSEQLNATFSDGAEQFMFCGSGGASGTPFAVTGQMLQPGSVHLEDSAMGSTSPWSFSLNVDAGTHELVAVGATQMLIRRNLALAAATALPDVDLTAGTAYTPVTATVTGAIATDSIQIRSGLYTGDDFATLSDTTDSTIVYAPAALLVQNDQGQVDVEVENMAKTTSRSAFVFDATPTTFTLPPVLTGVTFGTSTPIAATWGTLPAYDNVGIVAFGGTAVSFAEQNLSATKAWLTKAGVTTLAFASDATGYNPAWNVPVAGAFTELSVTKASQTGSTSTGVISGGGSALARVHSKLRDDRRARHQH
jgi:hypothetical protein